MEKFGPTRIQGSERTTTGAPAKASFAGLAKDIHSEEARCSPDNGACG